jgi:hypothetical protein
VTPSTIMGADLRPGMVIKAHSRILKITDIEAPGSWARLADFVTTSGEERTFNLFEDSEYELRSAPARPRNRLVKVSLPPELAAAVERSRLGSSESTAEAVLRLVRQALDDWGG